MSQEDQFSSTDQDLMSLKNILGATWSYRGWLTRWTGIVVLAAVLLMWVLPQYHAVTIEVGPPLSSVGGSAATSGVSSSSGLSGVLSSIGLSNQSQANPYSLFTQLIYSRDVADRMVKNEKMLQVVFANQWDERTHSWHIAWSPGTILSMAINLIGDRPAWVQPDSMKLSEFITKYVTVTPDLDSGTSTIEIDYLDPAKAALLMNALFTETNGFIKDGVQKRSIAERKYILEQLPTLTDVYSRDALISVLASIEQQVVLTSVDLPYAADRLDGPSISTYPVFPNPVMFIAFGIMFGFFGSWAVLTFRILTGRLPAERVRQSGIVRRHGAVTRAFKALKSIPSDFRRT